MPASYHVAVHTTKGGVPFQNDFYFFTSSADASYLEAIDIGNQFIASTIYTDLLACMPSDVTAQGVTVRSVIADGGSASATATAVFPDASPGGRAPAMGTGQTSNQSGPMISYVPSLEPGERARVNKIFIPTVNESDAEDDKIGGGLLTAMDDLRNALSLGLTLTAGVAEWVAIIKKVVEVSPGVFAPVKFVRAVIKSASETFVASQRRRRPKSF